MTKSPKITKQYLEEDWKYVRNIMLLPTPTMDIFGTPCADKVKDKTASGFVIDEYF